MSDFFKKHWKALVAILAATVAFILGLIVGRRPNSQVLHTTTMGSDNQSLRLTNESLGRIEQSASNGLESDSAATSTTGKLQSSLEHGASTIDAAKNELDQLGGLLGIKPQAKSSPDSGESH